MNTGQPRRELAVKQIERRGAADVVRMGDEPKRLSEIGQLLNRVDVPNLQYATRKLVRSGLIETEGSLSATEVVPARLKSNS